MTSRDAPRPDAVLVFGDDGSSDADAAWGWVCSHLWPGWSIEVVTAELPPMSPPIWERAPAPEEWESPHPRSAPPTCGFASLRHLHERSDPRVALGRRVDADLLVVGPRGHGPIKALVLGSTADWLLRSPPAPMVIARPPATGTSGHVIACVDGSPHAQAAVSAFAALPWSTSSTVAVLGAYDGWADPTAGIEAALKVLADAGVEAAPLERRGRAANTILGLADELEPDLIVLGTTGLTGWNRLRLGSTASAVVHGAHGSVLLASAHPPTAPGPEGS